jgi:hypothetical protein
MSEDKITRELTIAIRKADRRFEDDKAAGTKAYAEYLRSELDGRGLVLRLADQPAATETLTAEEWAVAEKALRGKSYVAATAPQGAPATCLHDWSFGRCNKCGMYWCDYDAARACEVVK